MKQLILLALATTAVHADDVALFELRFTDKTTRNVAIELHRDAAPATVENFEKLVNDGFYEGLAFHRAIPGTLVQIGDPLSKKKRRDKVGTGGPGYTLASEIRRKNVKGAVAAARLPDKVNPQRRSNGSQFYVCLLPQQQLDGQYTVFGNVIQGFDVLELVSNKPSDTNDYPIERIVIRKASMVPRESLTPTEPAAKPGAVPPGESKKPWYKRIWPW